jgi:hypothetical protein
MFHPPATRAKALGSERVARQLRDGLPGGDGAPRAVVDLDSHPAASDVDELALGDEQDAEAA